MVTLEVQEPKTKIRYFYSPHSRKTDANGLVEEFAACDVYVPEQLGWDENYAQTLDMLVEGQIKPEQVLKKNYPFYEFARVEYGLLYNSHKPYLLVDIPSTDPTDAQIDKVNLDLHRLPFRKDWDGKFAHLLEETHTLLRESANLQAKREEFITINLEKQLGKELFEWYPNLLQKDVIKVLVASGAMHTGMFIQSARLGKDVSRVFSTFPVTFDPYVEALRRYRFGKEVRDTLASHVLLQEVVCTLWSDRLKQFSTSQEEALFIRNLSNLLSKEDIEALFTAYYIAGNNPYVFGNQLLEKLQEK